MDQASHDRTRKRRRPSWRVARVLEATGGWPPASDRVQTRDATQRRDYRRGTRKNSVRLQRESLMNVRNVGVGFDSAVRLPAPSCEFQPTRTDTSAMRPLRNAITATSGRKWPSTLGRGGMRHAANTFSAGIARSSRGSRHPRRSALQGPHPPRQRGEYCPRRQKPVELKSALCDGFVKQAARQRRCQLCLHRHRARGLAENRHVTWITTKGRNVLLHPPQRRDLVKQAIVASADR